MGNTNLFVLINTFCLPLSEYNPTKNPHMFCIVNPAAGQEKLLAESGKAA